MRLSANIQRLFIALFLGFLAVHASAQTTVYLDSGAETTVTLNPGLCIITAYGAQGGSSTYNSMGGVGAEMKAEFNFTSMTTLTLLVGGVGPGEYYAGGGGGGSFVVNGTTPLVIAGGGGGSGLNVGGNGLIGSSGGNAGGQGGTNGLGGGGGGPSNDPGYNGQPPYPRQNPAAIAGVAGYGLFDSTGAWRMEGQVVHS